MLQTLNELITLSRNCVQFASDMYMCYITRQECTCDRIAHKQAVVNAKQDYDFFHANWQFNSPNITSTSSDITEILLFGSVYFVFTKNNPFLGKYMMIIKPVK